MTTQTLRAARPALLVALAGALIASTLPCDAVCTAFQQAQAVRSVGDEDAHATSAGSHCAQTESEPRPPSRSPCDDDCPGCDAARWTLPASGIAAPDALAHDGSAAFTPPVTPSPRRPLAPMLHERHLPDPPSQDVLARTTILLL